MIAPTFDISRPYACSDVASQRETTVQFILTKEECVANDNPGHEVSGVGELELGAAVSNSVDRLNVNM